MVNKVALTSTQMQKELFKVLGKKKTEVNCLIKAVMQQDRCTFGNFI